MDPKDEVSLLEATLNQKAAEFEQLCAERHATGADRYGEITFLGNDVLRMMLEELADTANYCRMQGVKLLMLQDMLEEDLAGKMPSMKDGDDLQIGFDSFKGTKDVGWGKR